MVLALEGLAAFLSILLTDADSCSLAAIGIPSIQRCLITYILETRHSAVSFREKSLAFAQAHLDRPEADEFYGWPPPPAAP
ncbi:hypothetical protein thsrh120_63140 [Rhizobium sp. No.120]